MKLHVHLQFKSVSENKDEVSNFHQIIYFIKYVKTREIYLGIGAVQVLRKQFFCNYLLLSSNSVVLSTRYIHTRSFALLRRNLLQGLQFVR